MFDEIFIGSITIWTIVKIAVILAVFLIFKNVIVKAILGLVKKLAEKWKLSIVSLTIDNTEKYLKRMVLLTGVFAALMVIPFAGNIVLIVYKVYRILMILTLVSCLLNLLDSYSNVIINSKDEFFTKKAVYKTLFPLLIKAAKFLIILFAVVIIAVDLGFQELKSLLAGVGIGGVAVALAAQDLLKNVFGGFVILTDRTFNAGDFIKIDSNEGIVEEVGIRSTKVRTLEQELIVVPNSKFSDGAVINYSKRGTRRVKQTLGATYSTSSDSLRNVIRRIDEMLKSDSRLVPSSVNVKFDGFGGSSLDVLVVYLVNTADYNEYVAVKEDINFKIMKIFEEEHVDFAFPSLSVYMEK